jgi:protein-S-isoprenylcysteine O-methyltransferase Ste14
MDLKSVKQYIGRLQEVLDFEPLQNLPQFKGSAIGKIGTAGFLLGIVGGIHIGILIVSTCFHLLTNVYEAGSPIENLNSGRVEDLSSGVPRLGFLIQWSAYVTCLVFFHFAEFFITAVKQPKVLSYTSYLINHSTNYTIANLIAWAEYWIECALFGSTWKHNVHCATLGLVVLVVGQTVRSAGMWQCGEHFAHEIMTSKKEGHMLVTSGIYSVLRHPAYFGWFYWSVGTQLLLCNPVCAVAYAYVSWNFFAGRIPYEEGLLLNFYGQRYENYMRTSHVGIPMIRNGVVERR